MFLTISLCNILLINILRHGMFRSDHEMIWNESRKWNCIMLCVDCELWCTHPLSHFLLLTQRIMAERGIVIEGTFSFSKTLKRLFALTFPYFFSRTISQIIFLLLQELVDVLKRPMLLSDWLHIPWLSWETLQSECDLKYHCSIRWNDWSNKIKSDLVCFYAQSMIWNGFLSIFFRLLAMILLPNWFNFSVSWCH